MHRMTGTGKASATHRKAIGNWDDRDSSQDSQISVPSVLPGPHSLCQTPTKSCRPGLERWKSAVECWPCRMHSPHRPSLEVDNCCLNDSPALPIHHHGPTKRICQAIRVKIFRPCCFPVILLEAWTDYFEKITLQDYKSLFWHIHTQKCNQES